MKRITLYEDMGDDAADYMEATFLADQDWGYLTKHELLQHQKELRKQKEAYEQRNKTFLSEERKRAWLN